LFEVMQRYKNVLYLTNKKSGIFYINS